MPGLSMSQQSENRLCPPAGHGSQITTHLDSWAGPAPELLLTLSFPVPQASTTQGVGEGMALWRGLDRDWVAWPQPDHMLAV